MREFQLRKKEFDKLSIFQKIAYYEYYQHVNPRYINKFELEQLLKIEKELL